MDGDTPRPWDWKETVYRDNVDLAYLAAECLRLNFNPSKTMSDKQVFATTSCIKRITQGYRHFSKVFGEQIPAYTFKPLSLSGGAEEEEEE